MNNEYKLKLKKRNKMAPVSKLTRWHSKLTMCQQNGLQTAIATLSVKIAVRKTYSIKVPFWQKRNS